MGNPSLIFAYGTLKQGFCNGHLLERARLVALEALTAQAGYRMISFGDYPAVVAGSWRISGQVFEVDPPTLHALDIFECHPDVYQRELVGVSGLEKAAWMYVMNKSRARQALRPGGDISRDRRRRVQTWERRR